MHSRAVSCREGTVELLKRCGWVWRIARMGHEGSGSVVLEIPLAKTLYIICPAANWLGLRQCHSSIQLCSHWPEISRGTYAPPGRITFPSLLRLHFPSLIYSNTSMQLQMKCSGDPQKLQLPPPPGEGRGGRSLVVARLFC